MKKRIIFSMLIFVLILSIIVPVFAATIPNLIVGEMLDSVNPGEEMEQNNGEINQVIGSVINNYGVINEIARDIYLYYDGMVDNNYGTIIKNNSRLNNVKENGIVKENAATIVCVYNGGIVEINSGDIKSAVEVGGIVRKNTGSINCNVGTVEENSGTVTINGSSSAPNATVKNTDKGIVETNYGVVTGGTVINNYGTVIDGSVTNNYGNVTDGKVTNNYATVDGGSVENNEGTATNAEIKNNKGSVTSGNVENNYSEAITKSVITNNYSDIVGNENIITNNFANAIMNAAPENQYYKLNLEGNIELSVEMDLEGNKNDNIFVDSNGQTWIRAEDAMYLVKAKEGYKLLDNPIIYVDGNTQYSLEGPRMFVLKNVDSEVSISATTTKMNKLIFDANGGVFENGSSQIKYDDADECDFSNVEEPTKEGFDFKGYYTEDGKSFEEICGNVEGGIDKDVTFKAEWEKKAVKVDQPLQDIPSSQQPTGNPQPAPQATTTQNVLENPKTGDSVILFAIIFTISVAGIFIIKR